MERARKCSAEFPGLWWAWGKALSQKVLWPWQLLALRNSFLGLQSRQIQMLAITEFIRDDCFARGKDPTEISLMDVSRGLLGGGQGIQKQAEQALGQAGNQTV